jgi:GcrA cell cycle regulator
MNIRAKVSDADLEQAQREVGWTENRTRVCGLLYNSGLSASQCACLLGGVTRNAVIGKVHRAELSDDSRPLHRFSNGAAAGTRPRPVREPRAVRVTIPRVKHDDPPPPPPPPIVDAAIPHLQRKQLLDLTDNCCRWPVGEPGQPDFFFCGAFVNQANRDRLRPYCASHTHRSHDLSRSPKRRDLAEAMLPKLSHARVNNDFRR